MLRIKRDKDTNKVVYSIEEKPLTCNKEYTRIEKRDADAARVIAAAASPRVDFETWKSTYSSTIKFIVHTFANTVQNDFDVDTEKTIAFKKNMVDNITRWLYKNSASSLKENFFGGSAREYEEDYDY